MPDAGRQVWNLPNVNILRFVRFEVLMLVNMENKLEDGGSTLLVNFYQTTCCHIPEDGILSVYDVIILIQLLV
jgi:hypothetical protein